MSINAATGALTRWNRRRPSTTQQAPVASRRTDGSHLYVAASGVPAGFIEALSVDSAGVLTATSQVPSGHGRSCIAVDASGEFMYVNHSDDNAVDTYSISQGGGWVTPIEQDPTVGFRKLSHSHRKESGVAT